jgi:hypothetical protein
MEKHKTTYSGGVEGKWYMRSVTWSGSHPDPVYSALTLLATNTPDN